MDDLLKAKAKLYHELLKVDPDRITEAELDLMQGLVKDSGIQQILRDRAKS